LRSLVPAGSKALFLPVTNDFGITYIAPRANIVAYNIGGDKNIRKAIAGWPQVLKNNFKTSQAKELPSDIVGDILEILAERRADVVILPFFDGRLDFHRFSKAKPGINMKKNALLVLTKLKESEGIRIDLEPWFALNRLESTNLSKQNDALEIFKTVIGSALKDSHPTQSAISPQTYPRYPIVVDPELERNVSVFGEGWHAPETHHVWSILRQLD
jgi:hypothetical protein